MKSKDGIGTVIVAVVAMIILGIVAFNGAASDMQDDDIIHINQNEQTEVVPDKIKVVLSVVSVNEDIDVAMRENTAKNNDIISGFTDDYKVETTSYSINEKTEWNSEERKSDVLGFEVYNTIEVTSEDVSKAGEIVRNGVDLGANRIEGVSYIVSRERQEEVKDELLEKAVAKAKNKAESVAALMDKEVEEIKDISFNEYYNPVYQNDYAALSRVSDEAMASAPSFEPGSQTITLNVDVAFEVD